MKKRVIAFLSILLAALLWIPWMYYAAPAEAASIPESQNVRVGLYYGSNALPGANLLNSVGEGYRFGYYDSELNFQPLAVTTETAISVVKTQNVYYLPLSDGLYGYTDAGTSGVGVGCYHVQLPGTYESYEEVTAAQAGCGVSGAFPAWIDGVYYLRVGAYLDGDSARAAQSALSIGGTEIVGTSIYGVSVVKTGTSQVLFQFDGGSTRALGALPGQGAEGEAKSTTWFKKVKYFGGFRFERINGGNLTVVNIVNLEDYVNCVISQEMSNSWPLEALKAQACCARTYVARATRHSAQHFDVCATTDCQAYPGCGQIGSNTTQAAAETAGLYIWYEDTLAETFYFSSDGGATEDVKNVWVANHPYLTGVIDPYEAAVSNRIPSYNWSFTFTRAELKEKLNRSGRACGDIVDFRVSQYTPMGNVRSITFTDSNGKAWSFYGDDARIILGVRSLRFQVSGGGNFYVDESGGLLTGFSGSYALDGSGNVTPIDTADGMPYVITSGGVEQLVSSGDSYTVSGTGWGHNVGMSQWGAYSMATQGFTYDQIIKFYFTGVELR